MRVPLVTVCTALVFAGMWGAIGLQLAETALTNDFLNLYTGGRMALENRWQDLHDPQEQLAFERRYREVETLRPFVRPAFYAALLAPAAALGFETAFLIWTAGWWTLLAGCCWWAAKEFHPDSIVLGAMFLPAALGIAHGQDCVMMLAIMAASYALTSHERHFSAGAVAGLLVVKFHLALLFPMLLAVQRRWRALGGFCATAFLCAAVSVAIAGVDGARQYITLLTRTDASLISPGLQLMVNTGGLLINLGVENKAAEISLSLIAVVLAGVAARRDWWRMYPAAAAGALLAMPHTYAYDVAFLLPGLWAVVYRSESKLMKAVAVALCTPIPYGLNLAEAPWPAVTPMLLLALLVCLAAIPSPSRLPCDEKPVRRNVLPVGNELAVNQPAVPSE